MSEPRIKYWEIAPDSIAKMRQMEHHLNAESGMDHSLLELIRLRASQMNGCASCIEIHTRELNKLNEAPQRIAEVEEWRNSDLYTKRERAALSWTEVVTNIQDGHAPDAVYDEVRAVFSEVEAVNLTVAIGSINAWNRLTVALGVHENEGAHEVTE